MPFAIPSRGVQVHAHHGRRAAERGIPEGFHKFRERCAGVLRTQEARYEMTHRRIPREQFDPGFEPHDFLTGVSSVSHFLLQ